MTLYNKSSQDDFQDELETELLSDRERSSSNSISKSISTLLIAGGSGITVIRSVLHSIIKRHHQLQQQGIDSKSRIKDVHLIWITRRYDSLSLLQDSEAKEEQVDIGKGTGTHAEISSNSTSSSQDENVNVLKRSDSMRKPFFTGMDHEKVDHEHGVTDAYRVDIMSDRNMEEKLNIKVTIHITGLDVSVSEAEVEMKRNIQELQSQHPEYNIKYHIAGRPNWDELLSSWSFCCDSTMNNDNGTMNKNECGVIQVCGPIGMKDDILASLVKQKKQAHVKLYDESFIL
jgi:hypothetical protein